MSSIGQRISHILRAPARWFGRRRIDLEDVSDSGKHLYPRRLLIYEDKVHFTAAVALAKTFAVFPFLYTSFTISWNEIKHGAYTEAAFHSLATAIPIPLISFLSGPYVSNIFLILPITARASAGALRRFAANMPGSTSVQIQTLGGMIGFAKTRQFTLEQLRTLPRRTGRYANFATADAYKAWFALGRHFYVRGQGELSVIRAPGVWAEVQKRIQHQTLHSVGDRTKAVFGSRISRSRQASRMIDSLPGKTSQPKTNKRV